MIDAAYCHFRSGLHLETNKQASELLDFFLPIPSLSITSSSHCTRGPEREGPPRSRKIGLEGPASGSLDRSGCASSAVIVIVRLPCEALSGCGLILVAIFALLSLYGEESRLEEMSSFVTVSSCLRPIWATSAVLCEIVHGLIAQRSV